VFLKARTYGGYFHNRRGLIFNSWSDYDGYPFEDFYSAKKWPDRGKPSWEITFCFTDWVKGADFEYTALAAKNNTTAYKKRPSGPARETKFALERCIFNSNAESLEWAVSFYRELVEGCEGLEATEKDLRVWAQSGLNMQVLCSKPYCWSEGSTVSNKRLCEFVSAGLSMEALRQRMICKECSTREPYLRPI
jgi:hypothetical protein